MNLNFRDRYYGRVVTQIKIMSSNLKLHAWLTTDTLDVFADITNARTATQAVHWRFGIPDGVKLLQRNRLQGTVVLGPSELDRIGVSICRTSLEQMSEIGSKQLRIEMWVGDSDSPNGSPVDADAKTMNQLIEIGRLTRTPRRN